MNCTLVPACGICIPVKQQGDCVYISVIVLAHLQPLYSLHIDCFSMYRSIWIWIGGFKLQFCHQVRSHVFPTFTLISVQCVSVTTSPLQTETGNSNMWCHLTFPYWFINSEEHVDFVGRELIFRAHTGLNSVWPYYLWSRKCFFLPRTSCRVLWFRFFSCCN